MTQESKIKSTHRSRMGTGPGTGTETGPGTGTKKGFYGTIRKKMMKKMILILILLFMPADTRADEAEILRIYITDFLQPISKTRSYRKRLAVALKLVPSIIAHARLQEIDPLLVAVIISAESSWDFAAVGKLGERGLMQTHGRASRGFDMSDPVQQIAAGCAHLARALKFCKGDLPGALTRYSTGGECRPIASFVSWRLRAYKRAVKKYRE